MKTSIVLFVCFMLCSPRPIASISNGSSQRLLDVDPCYDAVDQFEIKSIDLIKETKSCSWAKVNGKMKSRCAIEEVQLNCPNTCGMCSSKQVDQQLSSLHEASKQRRRAVKRMSFRPERRNAASSTTEYEWCEDMEGRFSITSISWIKKKKNCAWADTSKKWSRCKIEEVKENCPKVCGYCNCIDNDSDFYVSSLGKNKKCNWVKRKKTWARCNYYPEVKNNCPLTCGECNESFPSSAPSPTPSIKLFPTKKVSAAIKFTLCDVSIPTDSTDLATFEKILNDVYIKYLPQGAEIASIVTTTSDTTYTVDKYFQCTTDSCDDQTDNVNTYKDELVTLATEAFTNNKIQDDIEEMANDLNFSMVWVMCVAKDLSSNGDASPKVKAQTPIESLVDFTET